jgi:DNA-binding MarR family transcriptional regulator
MKNRPEYKHPESKILVRLALFMTGALGKMAHQSGMLPIHDLTHQQIKFIMMLHFGGPKKLSDLSKMFSVTKGTMTAGIQKLLNKKLVLKKQDAIDKRVFYLSLSVKGQQIVDRILQRFTKMFDAVCDELSPQERTRFVKSHEFILDTYQKFQMSKLPKASK